MRLAWFGVLVFSGASACGTEVESDTLADTADTIVEVDIVDTSDVLDSGPDLETVDTLELDSADTTEPDVDVEDDVFDVFDVFDTIDVSDGLDEDTVDDTSDMLDTSDTLDEDTPEDTDTDSEVDAHEDTLEDLSDGELTDVDSDTDDVAEDTSDLSDADTFEPIDTVDNPCLFPRGLHPERYEPMAELRGPALRAALQSFVSQGSVGFDYDSARDLMYGITAAIDVDADLTIECVYTGYRKLADGTRSPGSGSTEITTEHSWPRSDGAAVFPAEGDIHHLFPALGPANNSRGNYEFGDVACGVGWPRSCEWADGGSFLGLAIDGRSKVFQVRPERRGDIARAHFYFAVRYNRPIPALEEATLRRWHCEDPPSERERARTTAIEVHQRNRNPFVDQPFWVERILDY